MRITPIVLSVLVFVAPAKAEDDRKLTFRLLQKHSDLGQSQPFSGLSAAVNGNTNETKLNCESVTDADGRLLCRLGSCNVDSELRDLRWVAFEPRDGFEGDWDQAVKIRGCRIINESPTELVFQYWALLVAQRIQRRLQEDRYSDFPVDRVALFNGGISGNVLASELAKASISDPVLADDRWVVKPQLAEFTLAAQDLSALYLNIAQTAPNPVEKEAAVRQAAQWSAYFKASFNVVLAKTTARNLSVEGHADLIYSAKLIDVFTNASELVKVIDREKMPNRTAENLMALADSESLGTHEVEAWSEIVGATRERIF